MVKLTIAVKKKADISVEDFHDYWRTTHAELIKGLGISRYIRKYVQCHTAAEEYAAGEPAYDGTAEVWFDSAADKEKFLADPEFAEKVVPDNLKFADMEKTVFFLTREEAVI